MTRWTAALQKHLEELVRLHERLLRLVEARLKAMGVRDAARLELLLAEERTLALAIFEEERRRQVTMIHLAGDLGLAPQQIPQLSVAEVARRAGAPLGDRLLALRDRLHTLATAIQRTNETALKLAPRCRPYFEEQLGSLLEGSVGQSTYTPGGLTARAGARGMNVVDVRI
jgi:hypothetical protein